MRRRRRNSIQGWEPSPILRKNGRPLTEADIRTKFITPAIVGANGDKWDLMTQVREEVYFTKGRVIVRGKTVRRGEAKKADYILYYKPNIPLALIEAKDNNHAVGAVCSRRSSTPRCSTYPLRLQLQRRRLPGA
jgi:type I site-specific restriction endonuclease